MCANADPSSLSIRELFFQYPDGFKQPNCQVLENQELVQKALSVRKCVQGVIYFPSEPCDFPKQLSYATIEELGQKYKNLKNAAFRRAYMADPFKDSPPEEELLGRFKQFSWTYQAHFVFPVPFFIPEKLLENKKIGDTIVLQLDERELKLTILNYMPPTYSYMEDNVSKEDALRNFYLSCFKA